MGVPAGTEEEAAAARSRVTGEPARARGGSHVLLAATGKNREKAANSSRANSSAKPVEPFILFESDAGLLEPGHVAGHGKLSSLFAGAFNRSSAR